MPRLLVTGHSGFVGSTLFTDRGMAAVRRDWSLVALPDTCDLTADSLGPAIADARPDAVLHLAGRTSVAESFGDPDGYFDVNFGGTLTLLRALRTANFRGRFVFVGSGDCYGLVAPEHLPIREDQPLHPRSPYAVSKVAAEALCYQWTQTDGLDGILTRSFNHVGPRQDERFVVAGFARQVARIRLGKQAPKLSVGDIDVTRDFTDVRDVIRAYFALLERGRRGEVYNVASGREVAVREVLRTLLELAGVDAEIVVDASRVRRSEQRRVVADITRIRTDTHWMPDIPLRESLAKTLEYWMERTRSE